MRRFLPHFSAFGGARDVFAMNAFDASGHGLWLGAPWPRITQRSAERELLFTRVAAHLTSVNRLRRAKPASGPRDTEAVLSPEGELLHAEEPAKEDAARVELRRAAIAFDHARTREGRKDVERTTRRWRPLVLSRWSLLDEFESDGRRFIVVVDNRSPTRRLRGELSERESQILTQARLRHTNKLIAYELGLSASTVRVLMHRAARKLGVRTRQEAIDASPRREGSRPDRRRRRRRVTRYDGDPMTKAQRGSALPSRSTDGEPVASSDVTTDVDRGWNDAKSPPRS